MGALWSGQKLADMSGSVTEPSDRQKRHPIVQKIITSREKLQLFIPKLCFAHITRAKLREPAPCWLVPLLMMGILRGMLMIPTRSSVGTRERRMARIRRASPFPLLMS